MFQGLPMLACGSMGISAAEFNLLLIALVLWVASGFLAIANVCFIATLRRHQGAHLGLLLVYVGLSVAVFCGWLPGRDRWGALLVCLFAIPACVIGQFVLLLVHRRRQRARRGEGVPP